MGKTINQKGFTLIEILVSMAVASIFIGGLISIFRFNQMSAITQQQVMNMQQNLRAAITFIGEEIREIGYTAESKSSLRELYRKGSILQANPASIRFLIDRNGNGQTVDNIVDPQEDVMYYLSNDSNSDGVADGTPCDLMRMTYNDLSTAAVVAQNIDALRFDYLDWAGRRITNAIPDFISKIRSIQITMVARSNQAKPGFMFNKKDDTKYYTMRSISDAPNLLLDKSGSKADSLRRICLHKEIFLRNVVLERNLLETSNPINP